MKPVKLYSLATLLTVFHLLILVNSSPVVIDKAFYGLHLALTVRGKKNNQIYCIHCFVEKVCYRVVVFVNYVGGGGGFLGSSGSISSVSTGGNFGGSSMGSFGAFRGTGSFGSIFPWTGISSVS